MGSPSLPPPPAGRPGGWWAPQSSPGALVGPGAPGVSAGHAGSAAPEPGEVLCLWLQGPREGPGAGSGTPHPRGLLGVGWAGSVHFLTPRLGWRRGSRQVPQDRASRRRRQRGPGSTPGGKAGSLSSGFEFTKETGFPFGLQLFPGNISIGGTLPAPRGRHSPCYPPSPREGPSSELGGQGGGLSSSARGGPAWRSLAAAGYRWTQSGPSGHARPHRLPLRGPRDILGFGCCPASPLQPGPGARPALTVLGSGRETVDSGLQPVHGHQ